MNNTALFIRKVKFKIGSKFLGRGKINRKKADLLKHQYTGKTCKRGENKITDVSVIIPCYNHSKYIKAAVESLKKQTVPPSEVIFIDDNSTDGTPAILEELIAANKTGIRFKLIKNIKNIGQCKTINKGVESAGSELIMILNDDDYLMHDAVENILNIFNREKDIYLLGSKSIYIYNEIFFEDMKKFSFDYINGKEYILKKSLPADAAGYTTGREIDMAHSSCAFLKCAWQTVGGYYGMNKRIIQYSDRDFQLRVNLVYPVAVVENLAFSFWRINSSNDAGLFT